MPGQGEHSYKHRPFKQITKPLKRTVLLFNSLDDERTSGSRAGLQEQDSAIAHGFEELVHHSLVKPRHRQREGEST